MTTEEHAEMERLKSSLAQAQACCAEMRELSEQARVLADRALQNPDMHGPAIHLRATLIKLTSSTCGTALLEELTKLRAELDSWRHPKGAKTT